jgi:hypothetical protein
MLPELSTTIAFIIELWKWLLRYMGKQTFTQQERRREKTKLSAFFLARHKRHGFSSPALSELRKGHVLHPHQYIAPPHQSERPWLPFRFWEGRSSRRCENVK